MCGMPSFSTARPPSRRAAGATHAQLASPPSKGCSSDKHHLSCRPLIVSGSRSSHVLRSADPRQAAVSRSGMNTDGYVVSSTRCKEHWEFVRPAPLVGWGGLPGGVDLDTPKGCFLDRRSRHAHAVTTSDDRQYATA